MGSKKKRGEGFSNGPKHTVIPVLISVVPVPIWYCHFYHYGYRYQYGIATFIIMVVGTY